MGGSLAALGRVASMIWSYSSESQYCDHLAPVLDELRKRGESVEHVHGLTMRGHVRGEPVIVASRRDAGFLTKKRLAVIEHGAGQRYHRDAGGPDVPNWDVQLFLAPSQRVADDQAVVYPGAKRVAVGSPRVEHLSTLPRQPTEVVFSWHWPSGTQPEAKGAWDHFGGAAAALAKTMPVLGHGHPRMHSRLGPEYKRLNIPAEWDWGACVRRAKALVVDNSSIMWEACALGIPVVVVNAPFYRKEANWGLRFWEYADVGPQVDRPADLAEAVRQVLEEDRWAERRAEAAAYVYGEIAGSTARAADEIISTF